MNLSNSFEEKWFDFGWDFNFYCFYINSLNFWKEFENAEKRKTVVKTKKTTQSKAIEFCDYSESKNFTVWEFIPKESINLKPKVITSSCDDWPNCALKLNTHLY